METLSSFCSSLPQIYSDSHNCLSLDLMRLFHIMYHICIFPDTVLTNENATAMSRFVSTEQLRLKKLAPTLQNLYQLRLFFHHAGTSNKEYPVEIVVIQ